MNTGNDSKTFSRRAFVIGIFQAALLVVMGARLAWLQVVQGNRYKTLSDKNRISIKLIKPSRGHITDRFGVPLASNEQNFRVLIVPEQADDIEKSLRNLQQVIKIEDRSIRRVLGEAKRSAKFAQLEVRDSLTWDEVAAVEVNLVDLPGISIDIGESRSYPYAQATAHLVGYVGAPTQDDVQKDRTLSLPGFKIGKTAVERSLDVSLRGKAGAAEVEVNVMGREVRELDRKAPLKGERVILSIDGEYQRFVQNRLATQESASAIVMNVHTGSIYALVSHPGFDPNLFARSLPADVWEELLANPGHPLTNKATAGQYPPASTFKMMTALAGLRTGKITKGFTSYCPGYYDFGNNRFHCWERHGHGRVDLEKALFKSCDTYFYELADQIGIDNIAAVAREFGLGQKFDFEISEQSSGLVPDREWKMGYMGEQWRPGETVICSIGQGYLQSTPLQLAVMTSRLVNGGVAVEPRIVEHIGDRQVPIKIGEKINVTPEHLAMVKRGMDAVVNAEEGTAHASRILDTGMNMGGKTGTAQVKRISKRERQLGLHKKEMERRHRDHGLFVGYAPVENPQYACCVVVEHGGSGSTSAAPIARDILREVQVRNLANSQIKV